MPAATQYVATVLQFSSAPAARTTSQTRAKIHNPIGRATSIGWIGCFLILAGLAIKILSFANHFRPHASDALVLPRWPPRTRGVRRFVHARQTLVALAKSKVCLVWPRSDGRPS